MANIITSSSLETIREVDKLQSKTLIRKFGQENDSIELTILDLNDEVVLTDENFTDYQPAGVLDKQGLFNSVNIDFVNVLREYGLTSGVYKMKFSFQRKLILNSFDDYFFIETISPSRQEIIAKSNNLSDSQVEKGINGLIASLNSAYVKDINLNFGQGRYSLVINSAIDNFESPYRALFRFYEPLPIDINVNTPFRIIEEIINPIELIVDLGEGRETEDLNIEELSGPNLNVDFRLNTSVPSSYKCYDDILQNNIVSSSFNNLQNYLSSSIPVDLDFDQIDPESGYTFGNFIHFSSAVERLKNFKYKMGLIESYKNSINQLNTISGSTSQSIAVIGERNALQNNIDGVIKGLDYYERFLYFESGTYAWPKRNSSKPYIQYSVTSSQALTWLGSESPSSIYYGGQLLSASYYDDYNIHILRDTLPEHILNSPDNQQYITFVDMVGQHFDGIWAYIDSITDIPQADSKISDGISKELVFEALKQTGISAFDQFENTNLFEYLIGDDGQGNFQYQAPISQSMVRATASGSLPKGDITKELWKRLYHNAPYLLKTKGTERGIKALIATYGIPETILHVKEYGGPVVNKADIRTFEYQKYSKAYHANASQLSVRPISLTSTPNQYNTTLQGRFKTINDGTTGNNGRQRLMFAGGYLLELSQSIDKSLINSGNFAHILISSGTSTLASSDIQLPVYDGDFWNYTLTIDSSSNSVNAFATKISQNQNIWITSCSYNASPSNFVNISNTGYGAGANLLDYLVGRGFKGQIQEIRLYNEVLTTQTIATQSFSPFNYNGNSVSSSYENLLVRLSLGSNLNLIKYHTGSNLLNESPNLGYHTQYSGSVFILSGYQGNIEGAFSSSVETHYLTTPDTVGSAMVSSKVRIDSGSVYDDILSPVISAETSPQDRQPLDYSDIGVFWSPTFEINENIIYSLGPFRLDDYIGDPTHYTSGSYPDLDNLRGIYSRHINRRYDFYDYIKTIQYFDHTIFKLIEQFLPARANVKTGLLIEPHYLERTKFAGNPLVREEVLLQELNYYPTGGLLSTYETPIEPYYNILEIFDGSFDNPLENNATTSRRSSQYYHIVRPYNQPNAGVVQPGLAQQYSTDFTVGVNPNDGNNTPPLAPIR